MELPKSEAVPQTKLIFIKKPFINPSPGVRKDGIPVGRMGADGGDKDAVLSFAEEIGALSSHCKEA